MAEENPIAAANNKSGGFRLFVAQALDDVEAESHHELHRLFGEDAFL
jgi:hypothetical protein